MNDKAQQGVLKQDIKEKEVWSKSNLHRGYHPNSKMIKLQVSHSHNQRLLERLTLVRGQGEEEVQIRLRRVTLLCPQKSNLIIQNASQEIAAAARNLETVTM